MTSKQLRITILGLNYAPEQTGIAPYTTSLAEGLATAGHRVRVIAGYPHYPEWKRREGFSGWRRQETLNGVEVVRLRHFIPRRPSALKRMLMELSFGARLISERWETPDVVLVVSPALFSSGLALARLRLTRHRPASILWVQDLYGRGLMETGTGSHRVADLLSEVEGWILRAADHVVAIHDRFKEHAVNALGVRPEQALVVRNWTHLPPTPNFSRQDFRALLGWAPDEIVVLHAGNMGKKQGLENVIEAARLAQERQKHIRFVLMGDGNQRTKLEAIATNCGHVDFLDSLPGDMFQRALVSADVLLVNELPGIKEMAVPSKLTSYFNAGVPIVAATSIDSVTAAELSASSGGVRVDPADPSALLAAIEELAANPDASKALGRNGLRFRHETLSEAVAVGQYDDFITNLASSRGR